MVLVNLEFVVKIFFVLVCIDMVLRYFMLLFNKLVNNLVWFCDKFFSIFVFMVIYEFIGLEDFLSCFENLLNI